MSKTRKIAFNFISLATSQFLQRLMGFILVIVVARYYGKVFLGQYSFIMVYMTLFAMVANFGFETVMVRDIAMDVSRAKKVFLNIILIQSALGVFLLFPMIWLLVVMGKDLSIVVVMLFALSLIFMENTSSLSSSILEGMNKMYINASLLFLKRLLTTAIVTILVFSRRLDLLTLGIAIFLASMFNMLNYLLILKKEGILNGLRVEGDVVNGLIRIGFPFLLLKCVILLFNRVDIMMLSYLKGDEEVGVYSAVYYILESLMIIVNSFAIAFFPTMAQTLKGSMQMLMILFNKTFKLLFLISVFLATFISVTGLKITLLFYGEKFYPSGIVLSVVIWTLVFYSIDLPGSRLLFAADKKRALIYVFLCGLILNVGLNLFLVPKIGALGTAIAMLISMSVIFGVIFRIVNGSFFRVNILSVCWKGAVCAGLTAVVIMMVKSWNIFLLMLLAFIAYSGFLCIFKVIDMDDIDLFKKLIMKKDFKVGFNEGL